MSILYLEFSLDNSKKQSYNITKVIKVAVSSLSLEWLRLWSEGIAVMIWNIISLIGTIFGIAGTIISIITMINTNRIKFELTKIRMSASFKTEYNSIRKNLSNYIEFVKTKDMRCETVPEILKIVTNIQMYSESERWEKKKVVDDCVNFIKKNYDELIKNVRPKSPNVASLPNEKLNGELLMHLIDVSIELEREGINHDIGQN